MIQRPGDAAIMLTMHEFEIPDKLYFRIGEVAKLMGVEPYVLRYWESEFPEIVPTKSKSQQRLYRKQDVELIFKIRELLYSQKFTIKGAKKRIKDLKEARTVQAAEAPEQKKQIALDLISNKQSELVVRDMIRDVIKDMEDFLDN